MAAFLSMRMQVILDSSFARPGSAPIWGGKKGEFRDWTSNNFVGVTAFSSFSRQTKESSCLVSNCKVCKLIYNHHFLTLNEKFLRQNHFIPRRFHKFLNESHPFSNEELQSPFKKKASFEIIYPSPQETVNSYH